VQIPIKPYLVRIYVGSLVFFVLNKLLLRPLVADRPVPAWMDVVLYSSPNLIEAVMGMTTVAVLLLLARERLGRRWAQASDAAVYAATAFLAGTYVLTQEFKLHDLGGRNVYDPLDAVASCVGVGLMWLLFLRCGVLADGPSQAVARVPRRRKD